MTDAERSPPTLHIATFQQSSKSCAQLFITSPAIADKDVHYRATTHETLLQLTVSSARYRP